MKMLMSARPWAALLLVLGAGCAAPGPKSAPSAGSAPPPADPVQALDEGLLAAEASALRQDVYQLKAGLAALQLDLVALSNRLGATRAAAVPAPEGQPDLQKLQADSAREQARLRERIAELGRQLDGVRTGRVVAAAAPAARPDLPEEHRRALAAAAEREQKLREAGLAEETRLQNEIKALRKQMAALEDKAGDPRQVKALEKELEAARRQGEREREIAAEREKQVKALREALDARRDAPSPPPPPAAPAPEAVVTEREAAASAPAEEAVPAPVPPPEQPAEPRPEAEAKAPPPPPPPPEQTVAEQAPPSEPAPGKPGKKAKPDKSKPTPIQQVAAANVALQQGNLARAMALFRSALAEDESLVGARLGLAACAYSMDDLALARTRVDEVLVLDAGNVQALGLRGILNWREGRLAEADQDSAQAVAAAPEDAQLRNYRGIILHGLGRGEEAVDELREAVHLDPGHAEAMLNLAVLLASGSPARLEEAGEWYQRALAAGAARDEGLDQLLRAKGGAP